MIVERRRYVFRPGGAEAFLDAQERWNTPGIFGPLLARNVSYFETLAGEVETIVHLYRFASVAEWRALYEDYYAAQSPDYFATVRPLMLQQENALFEVAPFAGGDVPLARPGRVSPPSPAILDPARAIVVERVVDFAPGGLPRYRQALDEGAERVLLGRERLLGGLTSLVGRLHRVVWYHVHPDLADFETHRDAIARDPSERALAAACSAAIVGRTTTLMRGVGLPSRRALFEPT